MDSFIYGIEIYIVSIEATQGCRKVGLIGEGKYGVESLFRN